MIGGDLCRTGLLFAAGSNAALVTFLIYVGAVFGLAWFSNRLLKKRSFLSEYFLGSRSLGVWAFALTFAATSASGGSFTGFPSKIYTHGWILGLWIGSYIVVPICAMGLLGKRINQVARISGAITVPDVLRDRFGSPHLGLLAVSLIVFFMSFNLVAQFKSGSEILKTLLQDVGLYHEAVKQLNALQVSTQWFADVDSGYLFCLLAFAVSVIIYTTYGGFHAVVWTDVMQGCVMVLGVVIMLPLALSQVGGMRQATREMAEMTPPRWGLVQIDFAEPPGRNISDASPWFMLPGQSLELPRLFRVNGTLTVHARQRELQHVTVVEMTTPAGIQRQLQRLEAGGEVADLPAALYRVNQTGQVQWLSKSLRDQVNVDSEVTVTMSRSYRYGAGQVGTYISGPGPKPPAMPKNPGTLRIALDQPADVTVHRADGQLERQVMSASGRLLMAVDAGEYRVRAATSSQSAQQAVVVEPGGNHAVTLQWTDTPAPADNAESKPNGPSSAAGFLPLSLAISFFFMWAISGTGQPSSMVRLMAFKNTATLQRAIFTVSIYYSLIYFPLVLIFCCARVILPGMDLESDRIMPQMAVTLTEGIGQAWLAGLLVAAPFAAVMSTVDSFLLMISSALVRDIYQRNLNPQASEKLMRRLSYLFTLLVGAGATLGAVNPPQFLQDIIVYTGSGLAACFLAPMVFALYWPRSNLPGCMAGMLSGFLAHLCMYLTGWVVNDSFFAPYALFSLDPIVIGLVVSFATVPLVCLWTAPPDTQLVRKYFYRRRPSPPSAEQPPQ